MANSWGGVKTNWTSPNVPTAEDFNRIESNIGYLEEAMDTIDDGSLVKTNQDNVMTAKLVAKGGSDYTTSQIRNVVIVNTTPTTPSGKSGTIFLVVE